MRRGEDGETTDVKQARFSLSRETIAIVAVGVALAGFNFANFSDTRAEMRADRAEVRAEREAFANRITRLVEQQGTLNGLVEGLRHAIPLRPGSKSLRAKGGAYSIRVQTTVFPNSETPT